MDILAVSRFPDVAAHDKFCAAAEEVVDPNCPPYARPCYAPVLAACVMSIIYDQTGNGNHLLPATPAISNPLHYDMPVNATRHPVLLGGHEVYGAWFDLGNGYRAQNTSNVAVDNEPETICESTWLTIISACVKQVDPHRAILDVLSHRLSFTDMVTSGKHMNGGSCFDCKFIVPMPQCRDQPVSRTGYQRRPGLVRRCRCLIAFGADGNTENDCTNSSAYCDGCIETVAEFD